jgi:hypothetical protein
VLVVISVILHNLTIDDNNVNDCHSQYSDHVLHLRIALWDWIKSDNRHHSTHCSKHTRWSCFPSVCPGMVSVNIFSMKISHRFVKKICIMIFNNFIVKDRWIFISYSFHVSFIGHLTFCRDRFRTVVNYYIQALGVVITYETCKSSLESSENKPDNQEKPDVIVTISNGDINENVQRNLPITIPILASRMKRASLP